MTKIFRAAGIEISTAGGDESTDYIDISEIVQGGVTSSAQADALQAYIENELLNTKEHTNGQYQTGNYNEYWTSAKGNTLQPFQCTWWVYGRATMYLEEKFGGGVYPKHRGNAGVYYDTNVMNGGFNYGSNPRPNSIICWRGFGQGEYQYGHVAYVEGVTSDGIYISHAGYGEEWYGIDKIPLSGKFGNYGTPAGYIYLDSPNKWPNI